MIQLKAYRFELILLGHFLLGAISASIPRLLFPWFLFVLFGYGLFMTIRTQNRYGHAHLAAAYIGGMEMLLRMSAMGFPHETGKYSVILLLGTGILFRHRRQPWSWGGILFFLLLVPAVFVVDTILDLERFRQDISFNLSGPLCLAVSMFYFYKNRLYRSSLRHILQHVLFPIAAILGYLFIATPSIREIDFSYGANFEASGYGPNQMSSVLGLGIMILVMAFLMQLKVWRLNLVAVLFLLLLTYRGLLTFSRGGVLGPLLVLGISGGYYLYAMGFFRRRGLLSLIRFLILGILLFFSFLFVNQQTDNKLWERYAGRRGDKTITLDKYTSGRTQIVQIDWQIFKDYPLLGIGPGVGNEKRVEYGYRVKAAAHIEFTRLLAEHGVFGLLALGLLLFQPLVAFMDYKRTPDGRFVLMSMVLFCFTFMLHSATRIALPMFMYGLGFVYIIVDEGKQYMPKGERQSAKTSLTQYT